MTAPTIHLNGTSADDLQEALREAYAKVREAAEAVAKTAPNGRDYYPQGPDAIAAAAREHAARMGALRAVEADMLALHDAIDAAQSHRPAASR